MINEYSTSMDGVGDVGHIQRYICEPCKINLKCSIRFYHHMVSDRYKQGVKRHQKALEYLPPPPPSLREKVLVVSKVFKNKNFYLSSDYDFEKDNENFEEIVGPICLKEVIRNCVGVLRLKAIPNGVSK
jgi:hypothetical protein